MKKLLAVAFLLSAFCGTTFAQRLEVLNAPEDNCHFIGDDADRNHPHPEWAPLQTKYYDLIRTRIFPFKYGDITNAFGPKLDKQPNDCALPSFVPAIVILSGTVISNDQRHTDFYAIGDIGCLEIFYSWDGKSVEDAVIYFHADSKFVRLWFNDYNAERLEWEKAKLDLVKTWFDDHLPKITDLGVVEVSGAVQTRVDLGGGKVCVIRTFVNPRTEMTNYWLILSMWLDTTNIAERKNSSVNENFLNPDEPIGFKMADNYYRLTPTLKKPYTDNYGPIYLTNYDGMIAITNYNDNITITKYTGSGGDVTIPETINGLPVTEIADGAFEKQDTVTSVIIPDSITSIGFSAFSVCTSLTNVTIGNGVTAIQNSTFTGCSKLTNVRIGNHVKIIQSYAFAGCPLKNLMIPDSVTYIEKAAFDGRR